MKNNINDFRNASDKAADDNGLLFRMLKYLNLSINGEETEEFTDSEKVKNNPETSSVEDFIREMEEVDYAVIRDIVNELNETYKVIDDMGMIDKHRMIEAMDHFDRVIEQVSRPQPISEEFQRELDQLVEDTIDRNRELSPEDIERFEKMKKVGESLRGKVSEIAKNPETTEVNLAELVPEEEKEQTQEYLKEAFDSYYSAKIQRTIAGRKFTKMQPYGRAPQANEKKIYRPVPGTEEHTKEVLSKLRSGPGISIDAKVADKVMEEGGTIEDALEQQTEEFTGLGVPSKEVLDEIEKNAGEPIHIDPAKKPKENDTATLEEHSERDIVAEETVDEVEAEEIGEDFLPGIEPTMEVSMEELEEERVAEPAEEPSVETELEETERVVTEEKTVEEVEAIEQEGEEKSQEEPVQEVMEEQEREEEQRDEVELNETMEAQEVSDEKEGKPGLFQSIANSFKNFINRFTQKRLDKGQTEEKSAVVAETEDKGEDSSKLDNKWQLQGQELATFRDKESQVIADQKKTMEGPEAPENDGPDRDSEDMQI